MKRKAENEVQNLIAVDNFRITSYVLASICWNSGYWYNYWTVEHHRRRQFVGAEVSLAGGADSDLKVGYGRNLEMGESFFYFYLCFWMFGAVCLLFVFLTVFVENEGGLVWVGSFASFICWIVEWENQFREGIMFVFFSFFIVLLENSWHMFLHFLIFV